MASLKTAVNGEQIGEEYEEGKRLKLNKPGSIKTKLTIGLWVNSWRNRTKQFHGMISNIRIFAGKQANNLINLSHHPCDTEGDYMDWESMLWEVTGKYVTVSENQQTLCHEHEYRETVLAVPIPVTQNHALEVCQLLGNATMHVASNQSELVQWLKWYNQMSPDCLEIWTPFSDQQEEGIFRSLVDSSISDYMPFLDGQPNGGRTENSVVIFPVKEMTPYVDVNSNRKACGWCKVNLSLLLKLRGACHESYFGRFFLLLLSIFYQPNIFLLDTSFSIFNVDSLVGFNGWTTSYIR